MIHVSIDLAGATPLEAEVPAGTGPGSALFTSLPAQLATVAGSIDARFVEAGTALAQAYEIVERIIAALEDVSHALEGETVSAAVADMHAIADRLTRLPEAQQQREAALATIGGSGKALREPLTKFDRTLQFLRICGLNIKIAAAGADGFSGFADMMVDRLDVAEAEMLVFARQIETVADGVAAARAAEQRLAVECVGVVPEVPLRLSRDAQLLRAEQVKSGALATRIAAAASDIRARIGSAIGALQIGDITRQRLEHVVSGLADLQALGPREPGDTIAGHTLALLAAQAEDASQDFRRQAGLLAQTLREVGPHATALIALTRDQVPPGDREDSPAPLELLELSIAEVRTLAGRLQEADAIADRIGSATLTTAEALAERLTVIQRVTLDVQQMAWNTDLRSRRLGDAGRGLGAVASEIRNFSLELESFSGDIAAMAALIFAAAQALHGADGRRVDVGAALDASLLCVRDGSRQVCNGLLGLDREASELGSFLQRVMGTVDCEAEFGAVLARASETLSEVACAIEPVDANPELAELLSRIAASYTMARERDVHRQFAPDQSSGAPERGLAVEPDDDDFDDGLF